MTMEMVLRPKKTEQNKKMQILMGEVELEHQQRIGIKEIDNLALVIVNSGLLVIVNIGILWVKK